VPPIVHASAHSFDRPSSARVSYLRGRSEFQHLWWSARRSAVAALVRRAGIGARHLAARAVGADGAEELSEVWRRRDEWTVAPQRDRKWSMVRVRPSSRSTSAAQPSSS
jgi:hypothetical protein